MPAINMDTKIEVWKTKLLDLGKRNRLLNYRETKRSSLSIQFPLCSDLYNSFVLNEKPLIFPYIRDEGESEDEYEDDEEVFDTVKTNQSQTETQRTLKALRDKAKIALEEQGVNILYLSFGFLKWREAEHSNYWYNSPILLVPVSLNIKSIASPFILKLHDDEIVVNPTLAYKLENDFGLNLPEYKEGEALNTLLSEISRRTAANGWEVISETGLSLLSFLKINMYNDLSKHKESIVSNPIVRTLSGDASASNVISDDVIDYDYDRKLTPQEIFQVVDADSSQQDAILCAKRGISFVLQGPPGTGKSQTITNIIAECLADCKKVLFVSEKMAALDVVHRRLTSAGLNDFCLILHSHKTNKRTVLDQLGETLALAEKKAALNDEAYQKLDSLQADKAFLNEYATQVFEVIEPLGKSIYHVNGALAHLDSFDYVAFQIDDIKKVSATQFNRFSFLLQQFAYTIGRMTDDYKSNPWYGIVASTVSHELRYDIGQKLEALLPKTQEAQECLDALFVKLSLSWDTSYQSIIDIIPIIKSASNATTIPSAWILGNNIESFFDEISSCEILKNSFWQSYEKLSESNRTIKANDPEIPLLPMSELITTDAIGVELGRFSVILASPPYSGIAADHNAAQNLFDEAKSIARRIDKLVALICEVYEDTVFNIDYNGILLRYKTEYTSVFKVFNKTYKEDKKTVQAQFRSIVKSVSDNQILELITNLRKVDELRAWFTINNENLQRTFGKLIVDEKSDYDRVSQHMTALSAIVSSVDILKQMLDTAQKAEESENLLISHYQFFYKGFDTKWEDIRSALAWAVSFRSYAEQLKYNTAFVELVCSGAIHGSIYAEAAAKLEAIVNNLNKEFLWFAGLFYDQSVLKSMKMPALYDRLLACKNGLSLLEEWIDFRTSREKCVAEGLSDYVSKIEELHLEASKIIPVFQKRFYRLWLDAILPDYPAVLNFRRRVHDNTIDEFVRLDKMQFDIAKARIRSSLINRLPSLQRFTSGVDETNILKRELAKQRRIMPIRKLFREIPNLLLKLKPCLMMSPLSVSLFLEAETYQFDTVIFDEASQVCTENAIGAISRGKQVIIAGDSKQLPPTNFFTASTSSDDDYDTDDDEDVDSDAYESILDEANLLPERTLLWHYRSRHEHLIAFSNAKIYKNNLITFPANIDKVPDNGVEYVYVQDGFYDRGGKKGNTIEAKKVAKLVFEHIKKYPNRSIGVIAFGEVQQMAIDTAIRGMRMENLEYERFFKEDTDEPFFVKNLENVQGDERDTIIFSIGYAKDAAGVFRMNFGPLSKSGGERRLNVAITRAKYNVKLVGSIMPTDIDVERILSDGPKLLRAYIDFAIHGTESLAREITESDVVEHDSPFEEAVYNFLDRKGYKVATQVGCSGYRIDMAVKHPTLSGVYILGVECDGATYHSARTARERDRLRQEVLENMGWNIYRIWSTDWIKDPHKEGEALVDAINNAHANFRDDTIAQSFNPIENEPQETDTFLSFDEVEKSAAEQENPYGFSTHNVTELNLFLSAPDSVKSFVNNEFPLHYELLCQKMASWYGNEKATVKIRREVDDLLRQLRGEIIRKDDFLYPKDWEVITVRVPNTRKIGHISINELAEAMHTIIQTAIGSTREGLCLETTRVYGWQRMTQGIGASMNAACDLLIKQGRAQELDGRIVSTQE